MSIRHHAPSPYHMLMFSSLQNQGQNQNMIFNFNSFIDNDSNACTGFKFQVDLTTF